VFSRKERLSRTDFEIALKAKRRGSSAHFLVLFPEKVEGYAVVIPKKVVRLSSARHRLKRQVLEALRAASPLPPALVVFPRSSAVGVHYEEMKSELAALISRQTT
jgi:ribonuclease P protein component